MKKMLPWLITILTAITLISIAAFVLLGFLNQGAIGKNDPPAAAGQIDAASLRLPADELVKVSSQLNELTTNLSDREYIVKLSFAFQLDSKRTKEQFDKIIDLSVRPIIIRTLADMTPDQISSAKGKEELCETLVELINPALVEGKIIKIQITNFIITPI